MILKIATFVDKSLKKIKVALVGSYIYSKHTNGVLKRFLIILLLVNFISVQAFEFTNTDMHFIDDQVNDSIVEYYRKTSDSLLTINPKKSDSLIFELYNIVFVDSTSTPINKADVLHDVGKHLVERGEYQRGIDSLQRSFRIRVKETPNDTNDLFKTLVVIGNGYFKARRIDSAYKYYNDVKIRMQEKGIYDINLFHSIMNIGIIYASMEIFDTALVYFDTAMIILDSAALGDSLDLSALYYYNYALLNTYSGKLIDADTFYKKSTEKYEEQLGEINTMTAGIHNNRGLNYYYSYDFAKAELSFKRSLEVYKLLNNEVPEKIAHIYYNLSSIALKKSQYKKAINYCLEGLGVVPKDDMKLQIYLNLATSYAELGEKEKADGYYLDALSMLDGDNVNPKRKYEVLSEYAIFLKESPNPLSSLGYFKNAVKEAEIRNGTSSIRYAESLLELGYYYVEIARNPDSAIKFLEKSRSIFDELRSEDDIDNLNKINQKRAETGIAKAYGLIYESTNDIKYLKLVDSLYTDVLNQRENIVKNLSTINKLIEIEAMNVAYADAVNCSYDLYTLTENDIYLSKVFNYLERSKSSALLAEVNTENALKTSDIPPETFEYENIIKDRINNFRQMIDNETALTKPDSAKLRFFESSLLPLLVEYDSLIGDIEKRFPKYYSVKYQSDIIGIRDIQENLEPDQAFLEYMIYDTSLYIVGITKDQIALEKIALDSSFYNSLTNIISVKNLNLNNQNISIFYKFKSDSYKLWRTLIEPINSLIDGKRLIIIPDGLLGYLPFDILIEYDHETELIDYCDLPYLIRKHPISYSYSGTLRYNNYFENNRKANSNSIVAFAPTYESSHDTVLKLEDLKQAKSEVKSLVRNHGGKAFVDDRATKTNFDSYSGKCDIIHLAMHAIINDSLPLQSKLVFYKDSDDENSNYLFSHEIFNKDLNASMVTLSACNTGTGEFKKGEGIMSLSRGFVYAGVPSIVMTLWEVQDVTGSKIMDQFYNNLFKGMPKDVALQKAKLSVLKKANMANSHPFFWSAYTINGDVGKIENHNEKKTGNYRFVTLAAIAFLSILLYRYLKGKKSPKLK